MKNENDSFIICIDKAAPEIESIDVECAECITPLVCAKSTLRQSESLGVKKKDLKFVCFDCFLKHEIKPETKIHGPTPEMMTEILKSLKHH